MRRVLLQYLGCLAWLPPLPSQACDALRTSYYVFGELYNPDGQGGATGVDKELMEALARRANLRLQATVDSRVRIWVGMRNGSLDVATSVLRTPDREALGDFVPYLVSRNVLLVRSRDAGRYTGLAAIEADPRARVAVVKSFAHAAPFDAWIQRLSQQGRVDEVGDFETVTRLFVAGRYAAMISSILALGQVGRAFGEADAFRWVEGTITDPFPAGLLLSRQTLDEPCRQLLRQHLNAMLRDGTVYDILKRNLGETLAQQARYLP